MLTSYRDYTGIFLKSSNMFNTKLLVENLQLRETDLGWAINNYHLRYILHNAALCLFSKEGLSRWFSDKLFACQTEDLGLIPWSGRSPGKGNSNPFQYSCLGNPTDRGARWATGHEIAKSWHDFMNKQWQKHIIGRCENKVALRNFLKCVWIIRNEL